MFKEYNEFIITRIFDFPRDILWQAWTEVNHLKQWRASKDNKIYIHGLELRPGGMFLYNTISPDGNSKWEKFVYRKTIPPEKLVFIHSFSNETAGIIRHPVITTWPLEILNTLNFTQVRDETTLILRAGPINASEAEHKTFHEFEATFRQEVTDSFDQLENYLPQMKYLKK